MDINLFHKTILLFDGECHLCNSAVNFILKKEKNEHLFFTPLQSKTGIEILNHYSLNTSKIDSLVLIENSKAYIKSTAVIKLTKYLKGLYPLAICLLIIPKILRDIVYNYIAKNRYKWFGKSNSCMIPEEKTLKRFL